MSSLPQAGGRWRNLNFPAWLRFALHLPPGRKLPVLESRGGGKLFARVLEGGAGWFLPVLATFNGTLGGSGRAFDGW